MLVLAHHLDDLAESFIMSAFNNGRLNTMKAHYLVPGEGGLRVARPLVRVREAALRDFARSAALPVIEDNCPACFEAPTERARVKRLLAAEEQETPALFGNLLKAMEPLMAAGAANASAAASDRAPTSAAGPEPAAEGPHGGGGDSDLD